MSILYDKPFKNYNEQIDKLEKEYGLNLSISSYTHIEEALKTLAYYNIVNGYKECFMINGKFLKNLTIYDIIVFNALEKHLLTTLFKYSTYVEEFFKTKMAYVIAKDISVDETIYLKKQFYNVSKKRKTKFSETVQKIKLSFSTKDQPTKYYEDNHNHIPPWILFKNVYFNSVIDLFTFLNKNMQLQIVNDYSLLKKMNIKNEFKTKNLKKMLTIIRKFRNKIAHNAKIFNYRVENTDEILHQEIKGILPNDFKTKNLKKMLTIIRKFRNKIAHNAKIFNYRVENTDEILHQEIKGILPNDFINFKDIRNNLGKTDMFAMIFSIVILLDNSILRLLFLNEIKNAFDRILKSKFGNKYLSLANIPFDIIDRIDSLLLFFK